VDGSTAAAWTDADARRGAADRPLAEFRLLGHLEVGNGDGAKAFGGPKQRALLAFLLLHAGEVVTTERLVDAIWGDEPPPTASAIVYGYVRKLRSALEATSAILSTRSSGYVLDIPGGSLDVAQFERLGGLGRQSLRAGDLGDARRLLGSALALWRGRALDGLDGDGFIRAEQSRLESLRLATILGRIEADLRLGGAAEVVDELQALAREHPLDEGIRGQLMVALYRTGNQAAALAAYQDIRRALAEELGLDPSRSLQELEGAILRQDPSLDLPVPGAKPRPIAGPSRTVPPALHLIEATDACPFVGLATFGVHDADIFFGRDRLVSEMAARLSAHGFLGVVGPSGSGKSSAVRAGLVPAVEAGAHGGTSGVRVILRPGAEPMRELDRAVFAALDESQRARLPAGRDPLIAAASTLPGGTRLLVVVDQFEEVFTHVSDAEVRSTFIETLVGASRAGTAAVVFALRADFYGRCAEEPTLSEVLAASQVLVGPMGRDEYRSVIEGPASRAGLVVEPALVERLIDEVEGRPGGLPLLSTSLVELWERRDARTMRLSALAATGGISGAVGRLAENAYGQLADPEQGAARAVFLRLAGGEGEAMARRRVSLAEFDIASKPDVERTLSVLTAARLLTADSGTVEVAHEALFREWPRLAAWLDEDQQGRRVRAHLTEAAREWDDADRAPSDLYRGARLAVALDWTSAHGTEVNDLELQFVEASRAVGLAEERRQQESNRRLKLLLVGAVIGLILAVAAGAVALVQRSDALRANTIADEERATADQARAAADAQALVARHAADTADAQRLGAEGLGAKDLDVALLLARQGEAIDDTAATRANLLAALVRSPAVIRITRPLGGRPQAIEVSRDGTTLVVGNNDGQSAVIDAATDRTRYVYQWPQGVIATDIADNNDIIVYSKGPRLTLLDPMTGTEVGAISYPEDGAALSWAPDLKTIGRVTKDGRSIKIYDAATMRVVRTLLAPAGTWIMDMWMRDGGMVLAPLLPGTMPSDRFAPFDEAGAMRFGVWGPGDVAPRWTGDISTPATRGQVWLGCALTRDAQTLLLPNTPSVGQAVLVDLRDGARRTLQGQHASQIMGGAFSPDGSLVATSGDDGATRLWEVKTGALVDTFAGHAGRVWTPTFSDVGGKLTLHTASLDGTVMTWDVSGSRRVGEPFEAGAGFDALPQRLEAGPRVAVSPDGRLLAANDPNGLAILDATTHAVIRQIKTQQPEGSFNATWSPDGTRLAVAGAGTAIAELYDTATWQLVAPAGGSLVGPAPDRIARGDELNPNDPAETGRRVNIARAIAFSPDSSELVAGADDGTVWTWDARTGAAVGQPLRLSGPVFDVAFDPVSGALAIAAETRDGAGVAEVYAPGERTPRYTVNVDDDYGRPEAVAFNPTGTVLATGGGKGDVRFWDAATGAELGPRIVTSAGWVLHLAWTKSGETLVSAGTDGTVRLIDVPTRTIAGVLPGPENAWVDASPSPDGSRLYVAYASGQAVDWALDPAAWAKDACTIAGRTLTQAEWAQYLPTRPFAPACTP
jgi:DNA-binding SARP family transcriptional activator/WD40 repeat protein